MEKQNKGLMVSIYRDTYDCAINKLYGKKNAILLIEDCKVFTEDKNTPAIKIIKRFINGRDYFHAEPAEKGFYAFGGSFLYTSDSRFPFDYPLPLHDRQMNLEVRY